MNLEKMDKLADKKRSLKTRLLVESKIKALENHWLNWFKQVNDNIKSCELICLDWVQETELPFWDRLLNQEPWTEFSALTKFLKVASEPEILELLLKNHPGVLPLRYLPDAPVLKTNEESVVIFAQMVRHNQLAPQKVYVFFVRMSPVVQMDLYDLMNTEHSDEIFPEEEDMVIMSLDGNWIIFKSLEQEWVYRNSSEIHQKFNRN